MASLDKVLGKRKNLAALEKALEVEFVKDPVRFFRGIIMPLLPKESKLEMDRDGGDPVAVAAGRWRWAWRGVRPF